MVKTLDPTDFSLFGGADSPSPPSSTSSPPSDGTEESSDEVAPSSTTEASLRKRSVPGAIKKDNSGKLGGGTEDDDEHSRVYGLEQTDFLWVMTEEPHRSRRLEILKAHPEITKLMGYTRTTKYLVFAVVSLQIITALLLRNTHPFSWKFVLAAYVIGGTANQNLFLAIHEITHNLAFKGVMKNRLLAMTANLGIGVPYSVVFKKYHIEHHKRMGEDMVDTDMPCKFEAMCLNNVAGKTFFAIFQILFYALRPGFIRSQGAFTRYHALNYLVVLSFNYALVKGSGSWYPVIYLLMSSFMAGSLHPLAGHFIAEHYAFEEGGLQETYSYYGWLNVFAYNVGYHNEHHDFPNIPWTRLKAVKDLAPEFYSHLVTHESWPYVTYRFITDPKVGMFSRVRRENKGD
ncbi:dihydroceramide delta(4)-desaturase [Mrakia frigida]|uniref:sphingolipid delta(4)-desaturase family protein n=1 Tax=Mrakia frigida TaxID=29902 RepID=UPI003FCBF76A